MKFLTWSLGVAVMLLGLELARSAHDSWSWVWIVWLVVWIFAGVVVALVAVAKLAAGKVGAGGLGGLRAGARPAPAPQKEE
jgi:hypothetical protein